MEVPKPTNQEMQNEYDYILAEQMTKNLLLQGLITKDEYEQIMAKNRDSFSPFISCKCRNDLLFQAFRVIDTLPQFERRRDNETDNKDRSGKGK